MQTTSENYEELAVGDTAFQRYTILGRLGRGSTSVVYEAESLEERGRIVALKVLNEASAKNRKLVELFRSEVKLAKQLDHPNLVKGYEYVKDGIWEAYAMELLSGGNLHDLIYHNGSLRIEESFHMLEQICCGLRALHKNGIVHRDLKPQNILIGSTWQVKITDFSTALVAGNRPLPYDYGQVGTLEYMSPEVLSKGKADERSDIFALGAIAYQMITGELPFPQTRFSDRSNANKRPKVIPPHKRTAECPKRLSKLIVKCLKVKPHRRIQTAEKFLDELRTVYQYVE